MTDREKLRKRILRMVGLGESAACAIVYKLQASDPTLRESDIRQQIWGLVDAGRICLTMKCGFVLKTGSVEP